MTPVVLMMSCLIGNIVSGGSSAVPTTTAGGRTMVPMAVYDPTTGSAIDPNAAVTVSSSSDFDGTFATVTSGLSTATTLTQLVPLSGTNRIAVRAAQCSSSAASTTTTDQQCRLYYGTGTNCATGTTALAGCFQPALGGCNFTEIVVPAGNALCWIHAATGSKIVTATYRYVP